jgi:hypothetical protein
MLEHYYAIQLKWGRRSNLTLTFLLAWFVTLNRPINRANAHDRTKRNIGRPLLQLHGSFYSSTINSPGKIHKTE